MLIICLLFKEIFGRPESNLFSENLSHPLHCAKSDAKIVFPLLSCILLISTGFTFFPPFTNVAYAEVKFINEVSTDPSDIESNSGISS